MTQSWLSSMRSPKNNITLENILVISFVSRLSGVIQKTFKEGLFCMLNNSFLERLVLEHVKGNVSQKWKSSYT